MDIVRAFTVSMMAGFVGQVCTNDTLGLYFPFSKHGPLHLHCFPAVKYRSARQAEASQPLFRLTPCHPYPSLQPAGRPLSRSVPATTTVQLQRSSPVGASPCTPTFPLPGLHHHLNAPPLHQHRSSQPHINAHPHLDVDASKLYHLDAGLAQAPHRGESPVFHFYFIFQIGPILNAHARTHTDIYT